MGASLASPLLCGAWAVGALGAGGGSLPSDSPADRALYSRLLLEEGREAQWTTGTGEEVEDEPSDSLLQIPRVFHRSHKYSVGELPSQPRLWANLLSCAELNGRYETRYYDDSQVDEVGNATLKMALRKLSVKPLSSVFVMRADWFRLAVLYLYGGWWLDGDVRCIDDVDDVLGCPAARSAVQAALLQAGAAGAHRGCILAWEGELPQPVSAPLNWALGCTRGHPLLLSAMSELAQRVLRIRLELQSDPDLVSASVETGQGPRYVDVLGTTGPKLLGEVLAAYAGRDLREVRGAAGEVRERRESWDRISAVCQASGTGVVVILPYCFFRSRGCGHLQARFADRVIFHHEFDTSWRQAFWHNYYAPNGQAEL